MGSLSTVSDIVESEQVPATPHTRLIGQNGEINIEFQNLGLRCSNYLHCNYWSALLDLRWYFKFLITSVAFTSSWVFFGSIWYTVALTHHDIFEGQLLINHTPCVTNMHSFTAAFLFSLETQVTIGYGVRRITEQCPLAIAVLVVQLILGIMLDVVVAGIIFAELSRPSRRSIMVQFSRKVLITLVDGFPCLVIRVADSKKCFLINCQVSAKLFTVLPSEEGMTMELVQNDVNFLETLSTHTPLLAFPVTFYHRVDERSPLWGILEENIHLQRFELIVILSGIIAATGTTCQARISYLPTDIIWSHGFPPALIVTHKGRYKAQLTALNMLTRS
ncbi:ATP-sensitive inward rectifier potassium channel 10-like [Rhinatrema bivittatum]|uniref:ATP-sensitive inward rectifier potassium channel 10-like n=1 Tax=Rhinatrema bivittatum TaxID=194408 RepID=UPI001129C867|nr:ATP-sensitive inward rectifier potassium channel 10-like [Rhinatrema bivittatum]